jgi:formylglycine-generating enzyme required for sulfatase activity
MVLPALSVVLAACALPTATITGSELKGGGSVAVGYSLADGPAVVTYEVQTNKENWTSAGIYGTASGEINRLVESGDRSFRLAGLTNAIPAGLFQSGDVRLVLTAWSATDTPDYLVVDLAENATTRVSYYASEAALPGGLLANPDYRTTKLVLKRIHARNVPFAAGSLGEAGRVAKNERLFQLALDHDYYLGVFEFTQKQWDMVASAYRAQNTWCYNNTADWEMRPCDLVCYNELRLAQSKTRSGSGPAYVAAGDWPNAPAEDSILGLLRARADGLVDFDLPSEAEWEFAARAGCGETQWPDGTSIADATTDANLARMARYAGNSGYASAIYQNHSDVAAADGGTAKVGSYEPNAFGLYDMLGNVHEFCLDYFEADVSAFGGAVNVSASDSTKTLSGAAVETRVVRGGGLDSAAGDCRPASRHEQAQIGRNNGSYVNGFRVKALMNLK